VFTVESEHEKAKALFEQKISYLENNIEDHQKKHSEYSVDLISQKKEHQITLKELYAKHDAQVKDLQIQLEETHERCQELDAAYKEM